MRLLSTSAIALLLCCPAASAQVDATEARRLLAAACHPAQTLAARADERAPRRLSAPQSFRLPDAPQTVGQPVPANLRGAIRRVTLPPGEKLVALTLDFCESPGEIAGYDGAILDSLRASGTKATLFMGGKWMLSHPARTEQMLADPLFEIGTHGLVHRNTRLLTGADLSREIAGPSVAYTAIRNKLVANQCAAPHAAALASLPTTPRLFRFPFGACNAAGLDAAANAGLLSIQWDVSTGDPWPGQSARAITDVMIRQVRPGSIVLAHANGRGHNTAQALPEAIAKLKAMGYRFVTVSELLVAGQPVITKDCYDARPGDTDKYDRLFPVK